MSALPRVSGRDCVRALAKAGFYLKRQEGSHIVLRRDEPFGLCACPRYFSINRVEKPHGDFSRQLNISPRQRKGRDYE
jgi:hypothetical protein